MKSKYLMAVLAAAGVVSVQGSASAQPLAWTFTNWFETSAERAAWSFAGNGNPHSFVNSAPLSQGGSWHVLMSVDANENKILRKSELFDLPPQYNPTWAVCQSFIWVKAGLPSSSFTFRVKSNTGGTLTTGTWTLSGSAWTQLITNAYNPTVGTTGTIELEMPSGVSFESNRIDSYKTECMFS